jgi:hypothetical protein
MCRKKSCSSSNSSSSYEQCIKVVTTESVKMDRLGQSLDDIIASRPKPDRGAKKGGGRGGVGGRGGGGGSKQSAKVVFRSEKKSGKVKAASHTVIRQPFVKKQIVERVGKASAGSIFDRLGTGAPASKANAVSGTQVMFANLRPDIVSGDIAELCGTVGEVKQVDIILNKSGRSTVMMSFLRGCGTPFTKAVCTPSVVSFMDVSHNVYRS